MPGQETRDGISGPDHFANMRDGEVVCSACGVPWTGIEGQWCCGERARRVHPIQVAEERREFRRDRDRLREAIADALADLTPGIAPHDLLTHALSRSEAP